MNRAIETRPEHDVLFLMLADAHREEGDELSASLVLATLGMKTAVRNMCEGLTPALAVLAQCFLKLSLALAPRAEAMRTSTDRVI